MGLDIDLYTPKIDIGDDGADDIIIEITGLKSISKFIGLEDTPLYYDNGKFFKVENNKIVYTDIQWKDISGNIEDAPEIVAFIKDLIEEISAEIVDDHITLHNIAKDAHPYIQNIIHENYVTLDTKIDDTKEELSQDISNLNDALNQEISDRETADNALSEDIQKEILDRIEGDVTLQGEIDTLNTNLQNEIDTRIEGDTKLSNSIDELSNNLIQEVLNRQEQDNILQEQITSNYNTLDDKIDTEISNRTSADVTLQNNINTEILARQNTDTVLQNNINTLSQTVTDNNTAVNNRIDETNDAVSNLSDTVTSNYNTLDGKINSEISNRTLADTALQNNIDAEALARQNADATLQDNIDALSDTVSDNYTDLDGKISDLTTTVNDNDTAINSKVDGINTTLTTSINSLSNTVSSNYTTLDTKIDTTKTSLEGDINDLSTTVSNNYTTLDSKITNLTSTVNDNYTELDDRITTNTNGISTINNKIPNQASSSNQLADKDFVNSSIATNTANFIGTFNSLAELEAYSGTLTNNDYAFVATIDSVGNTLYDRYKYNANTQEWLFEYELNNSSFTAVQWASINSGATTENINQIITNANDIIDLQTNKQDKLTAGANIQINNNIISATDTTYTAGSGISIENNVISNTQISAVWGNIQGTLSDQTDLQAVLDLKADKTELNTAVSELNTNIQNEATTRAENDTLLQNNINTLSQTVTANYNTLDDKIDTEISDRTVADTTLQTNIDAEASARQNSDATLQSNIDTLSDTVSSNYTTLDTKIDNTKNALDSDISDLSDTVTSNYNALDARITTNTGNIVTNTSDIADLQTDKQDVILDLTTIRSNASSGKNASDTIATYGNIVTHNINEFATSAQGALADTALQPNDNISELINDANYITSEDLPTVNNGVLTIQVNGDDLASFSANQAGNTTANIVVPDSATWGNIQGTLSNQTDLLNALNAKQNIISDLSTIRSGATLGATALQPNDNISELNNDAGYITEITSSDVTTALGYTPENVSNKVTSITSSSTDTQYPSAKLVYDQLAGKQPTLVSGDNIKTINSTSLLGAGNISVQPTITSSAMLSSDVVDDTNKTHKFATSAQLTQIATNTTDISTINGKIPAQATSSNQLADKAFVNSSVQTATANFRGNWDTWALVPASASSYPTDYAGSTTPTVNDYLVVQDASDYTGDTLEGTWRFKYSGTWATDGKNGWLPEYQVNETPLTVAQLASLNSGITNSDVTLIGTALQPEDLKTVNNVSIIGSGNIDIDSLPSQTGQSGKFLTTNGTTASWATISATVDQTYDGTSTNAQSGVAIAGANFLVNNAAGSTNGVAVRGSGGVQSTQIGVLGSAVSMSTSVGFSAYATGSQSITIGHGAQATASKSYAFGEQAKSTAIGAFQFGQATNNEAGSVYFGLTTDGMTTTNYKLLGSDGKIPDDRINSTIARASDIPAVNNATLTIQKNGTTVKTFTANASSDVTANITVPTKTSDLTNDDGFITGITSTDVTTALGYTPYNSTNPNGYQANVIETVKVNGTALTVTSKAVDVAVPTKVSDLTNDSGYTTNVGTVTSVNNTSPDNNGNVTISIPSAVTESTVSGWGFTKNTGTVTSVNNVSPVNGNVTLSIPASQVNSDWNASSGVAQILNKPTLGTMAAESASDYTPTSSLATVATSGSYNDLSNKPTIPTVNNATLTITQGGTTKGTFTANASSDVTIALDAGGSNVDIDNATITENSSDQLQTVAVKDNRSGNAIKTWTGTKAQYDAIATKDANTLYNITDDTDVTLSLLELLYPVGSLYIATSTLSACPLQTLGVGTWQLKSNATLVTNVDSIASVAGNGMALGLTDGTNNAGVLFDSQGYLEPYTGCYGASVGVANSGSSIKTVKAGGLTTDPTKSGLEATVTTTTLAVAIWERIS